MPDKCRLCLKQFHWKALRVNIFAEEGLAEGIFNVLGIQLDDLPEWPSEACTKCQQKVEDARKFSDLIKLSQDTLAAELKDDDSKERDSSPSPVPDKTSSGPPQLEVATIFAEDGEEETMSEQAFEDTEVDIMPLPENEEEEDDDDEVEDQVDEDLDQPKEKKVLPPRRARPVPVLPKRDRKSFVQMRHGQRPYTVDEETRLEEHMRGMGMLVCYLCNKSTESLLDLYQHFKSVHQKQASLNCCGTLHRIGLPAFEHADLHLNPELLKCHECNTSFRSKYILKTHKKHFHGIGRSAFKFKCEIGDCTRTFPTQGRLTGHIRTHLKPSKCSYCGKGFPSNNQLKRHVQRMHEVADRAVCDICGKWFSSACTLNIHLHRHRSQENKKPCEYCGKLVADMKQHVDVVHMGKRRGGIIRIPGHSPADPRVGG